MMTADDDRFLLLSAYCDGELSPLETLDVERRLAADPALRALAERLDALSGIVQRACASPPASAALRARVVRQIGFADPEPRRRALPPAWKSMAAVLMVGLIGGGLIGSEGSFGLLSMERSTTDAVIAGHLRGLIAPQPFDIASSNRHVVKPWFNGRTTIAPQAPDLAEQGFPLAGGRIDVVGGKAVPTLVYRHDQHVISVTIVPKVPGTFGGEERRDGSTVVRWNADDLTYLAVSDLEAAGLRSFVALFQAQIASGG